MREFVLNKLIRDEIFTNMQKLGQKIKYRVLGDEELAQALKAKLLEEAKEFNPADPKALDELTDMLEVIEGLAESLGLDFKKLRSKQLDRRLKRGGFKRQIFVETLILKDDDPWAVYYAAEPERFTEVKTGIDIHKAAGIIIRDHKLLVERSKGKKFFISPGGSIEEGENAKQALVRELMEEFKITVTEADLDEFGTFYAEAAGQEGKTVQMDVFIVNHWEGEPEPDSEVEEIAWVDSSNKDNLPLGSIFEKEVIPRLKAKNKIG